MQCSVVIDVACVRSVTGHVREVGRAVTRRFTGNVNKPSWCQCLMLLSLLLLQLMLLLPLTLKALLRHPQSKSLLLLLVVTVRNMNRLVTISIL